MRRLLISLAGVSALATGVFPAPAHAYNLNVFAGSNFHANETGLAAVELTAPMIAEVGPFFEWSRTSQGPEERYLAGVVGRITTPWMNFFVDSRVGYHFDNGFNLEVGLGYRFVGDTFDVMPRLGVNAVTVGSNIPDFNGSVGLAFAL